nr:MAG TPA: hypothetical protein [Caudoviricetes sp.]
MKKSPPPFGGGLFCPLRLRFVTTTRKGKLQFFGLSYFNPQGFHPVCTS